MFSPLIAAKCPIDSFKRKRLLSYYREEQIGLANIGCPPSKT